jgi:small-conductance mechanosensitive channel
MIFYPAVIFMCCIMVAEETGIRNGIGSGFKLSLDKLGTSVGYVVLYLVVAFGCVFLPLGGGLVKAFFLTVLVVVAYDIYYNSVKKEVVDTSNAVLNVFIEE